MQLVGQVRLYRSPFTVFVITEEYIFLPDVRYYKAIGVKTGDCCEVDEADVEGLETIVVKAPALFLQPFVKTCMNSEVYRSRVLQFLSTRSSRPESGLISLLLILKPAKKEVIDHSWNDKLLRLVWTRIEIENAFSWLSTLGGAYSALGDYFDHCAEEAGRISIRQYKLSQMLGDDGLAARSRLYSALSLAQKGNLKMSRHIVRQLHAFALASKDKRLVRMCQGVWAKLKYLRQQLKKPRLECQGDQ